MMNQTILVGRLVSDPQINETENGKEVTTITLAVTRHFKNIDGEYDTDFIPCLVWGGIAETTKAYCRKGDVVGIKGRLQTRDNKIEVIADKITFLSSSSKERE